jgi:hypothetical protein
MWKARVGDEDGQATVELVALLPALGLVLLVAWQAIVAGEARWLAGGAAREAARAAALGDDPAAAARRAVPRGRYRSGLTVATERGGGVRVRLSIPPVLDGVRLGSVTVRARMEPQR